MLNKDNTHHEFAVWLSKLAANRDPDASQQLKNIKRNAYINATERLIAVLVFCWCFMGFFALGAKSILYWSVICVSLLIIITTHFWKKKRLKRIRAEQLREYRANQTADNDAYKNGAAEKD